MGSCRRTAAIAILLVCGCAGSEETKDPTPEEVPPFDHYTSGTRLRARLLDGGDGATKIIGWRDTDLDADCDVRMTAGGYRCLPHGTQSFFFADPDCTESLHYGPPPDSGFVLTAVDGPCGEGANWQVWRVDEAQPGPDTIYGWAEPGHCVVQDIPPSEPRYRLLDASAELLPMSESTVADGALDFVFADGDDGSRALVAVVDHATGERCVEAGGPAVANDVDVCIPWRSEYVADGYFTSSDCSGEGRGSFTCYSTPCPAPSVGVLTEVSECETEITLFGLGAQTQGFYLSDGACEEAVFGPCVFYPVTTPIDPSAFPALQHSAVGEGRLQLDALNALGSPNIVAFGDFTDTDSGARCVPVELEGVTRCVPTPASVNPGLSMFSDADCTVPVAPGSEADPCSPLPLVALHYQQPDGVIITGAPADAAYRVEGRATIPTYRLQGPTCVEGGPQAVLTLTPLDPESLAPVALRTE